jgi:hypothetical protein
MGALRHKAIMTSVMDAIVNLIARIVNGATCGSRYFAPINPVPHKKAKMSGM